MVNKVVLACTELVRAQKCTALIEKETELRCSHDYPLEEGKLPLYFHFHIDKGPMPDIQPFGGDVLLEYIDNPTFDQYEGYERFIGYNSGARSLLVPHNGSLVKMKGIGSGLYNTCFDGKTIHGWGDEELHNAGGFFEKHKALNEIKTIDWLNEHGLDSSYLMMDVIGIGFYGNGVFYSPLSYMRGEKKESKRDIEVAVPIFGVESDLRVEEISPYVNFPYAEGMFEPGDLQDYIEWLGMSIGRCLRAVHATGVLHGANIHGTYNSNLLNFTISDSKVGICDHGSSRISDDPQIRRNELDALIDDVSGMVQRLPSKAIIDGYRGEEFDIEYKVKKECLLAACLLKKETAHLHDFTEQRAFRILNNIAERIGKVDSRQLLDGLLQKETFTVAQYKPYATENE